MTEQFEHALFATVETIVVVREQVDEHKVNRLLARRLRLCSSLHQGIRGR